MLTSGGEVPKIGKSEARKSVRWMLDLLDQSHNESETRCSPPQIHKACVAVTTADALAPIPSPFCTISTNSYDKKYSAALE